MTRPVAVAFGVSWPPSPRSTGIVDLALISFTKKGPVSSFVELSYEEFSEYPNPKKEMRVSKDVG